MLVPVWVLVLLWVWVLVWVLVPLWVLVPVWVPVAVCALVPVCVMVTVCVPVPIVQLVVGTEQAPGSWGQAATSHGVTPSSWQWGMRQSASDWQVVCHAAQIP